MGELYQGDVDMGYNEMMNRLVIRTIEDRGYVQTIVDQVPIRVKYTANHASSESKENEAAPDYTIIIRQRWQLPVTRTQLVRNCSLFRSSL